MSVYILFIVLTSGCGINCNNIGTSIDVFKTADKCLEVKEKIKKSIDKKRYSNISLHCIKREVH